MTTLMPSRAEKRCAPMFFAITATAALLAGCDSSVNGSPVAAPVASGSAPAATATAPAQAPGTLLPADLPRVMLPIEELRNITKAPSLVKIATWRHLGVGLGITFTPPQCGVVASNSLQVMFGGSSPTGVLYPNYMSTEQPLVQVYPGAVTFPDPAAARALIAAQLPVWQQCANSDVTIKTVDGTAAQHNNALQATADTLTLPITIGGNYQCVRTLAARNNVVFDNVVCAPSLSGEDATILNAMVAKLPR